MIMAERLSTFRTNQAHASESVSPFMDSVPQAMSGEIPSSHVGHQHMRSLLVSVFTITVVMIGLLSTMTLLRKPQDIRKQAASTGPKLSFEPSKKSAKVGDTFPLGISLATGDDTVSAVELHLTYDESAIQIVSFTNGTKLPTLLKPETHGNGVLSVILGAHPTAPFKGTDIVGTVNIKITGNKSSKINFAGNTAIASIGKNNNTLATNPAGAQITVGNAPNPTATPVTANPIPSPTPTPRNFQPTPTATPRAGVINPIPTASYPESQSSFGSITTTTNSLVTSPNYTTPVQNEPLLPSETVPDIPYPPAPTATPAEKSTYILESFFIMIGTFFQNIFSILSGKQ